LLERVPMLVTVLALSAAIASSAPPAEAPYAPDPARSTAAAVGWSLWLAELLVPPAALVATRLGDIGCKVDCEASGRLPLVLTTLPAVFTPSIPRWVVGAKTSAIVLTSVRAASWITGTALVAKDYSKYGGVAFVATYVVPLAIGLMDLAATPHREDLEPQPSAQGVRLVALGPNPVVGAAGLHGMTFDVAGTF